PAVENTVIADAVDQLCDLRREEALEPTDAFRALLRNRQLSGHFVEAGRQPLELVARRQIDPVVELSRADAGRPVLQEADRSKHAPGQSIGEYRGESRAGYKQCRRAPQSCVDRRECL